MQMTKSEIRRAFAEEADKPRALSLLAALNECGVDDIADLIGTAFSDRERLNAWEDAAPVVSKEEIAMAAERWQVYLPSEQKQFRKPVEGGNPPVGSADTPICTNGAGVGKPYMEANPRETLDILVQMIADISEREREALANANRISKQRWALSMLFDKLNKEGVNQ